MKEEYIYSIEKLLAKGQREISVPKDQKENVKKYFEEKGWRISSEKSELILEFVEPNNYKMLLD